jgi:MFS family permease
VGFLPLFAKQIGVGNIGLFYAVSGVTSILIRPILGRSSDRLGRGVSIGVAFVAQAIGLAFIMLANGLPMILAGAIFTALGGAINSAATTALAMDLANPLQRGRAMATFTASFQVGNGFGAVLAGGMADLVGYRGMYAGAIAITIIGIVLLAANWRSLRHPVPVPA